jgi:hypothetical protein
MKMYEKGLKRSTGKPEKTRYFSTASGQKSLA